MQGEAYTLPGVLKEAFVEGPLSWPMSGKQQPGLQVWGKWSQQRDWLALWPQCPDRRVLVQSRKAEGREEDSGGQGLGSQLTLATRGIMNFQRAEVEAERWGLKEF